MPPPCSRPLPNTLPQRSVPRQSSYYALLPESVRRFDAARLRRVASHRRHDGRQPRISSTSQTIGRPVGQRGRAPDRRPLAGFSSFPPTAPADLLAMAMTLSQDERRKRTLQVPSQREPLRRGAPKPLVTDASAGLDDFLSTRPALSSIFTWYICVASHCCNRCMSHREEIGRLPCAARGQGGSV